MIEGCQDVAMVLVCLLKALPVFWLKLHCLNPVQQLSQAVQSSDPVQPLDTTHLKTTEILLVYLKDEKWSTQCGPMPFHSQSKSDDTIGLFTACGIMCKLWLMNVILHHNYV